MSSDFLEGVECVRQMVIFDVVPRDFKVVKQSFRVEKDGDWAIQGNTGGWQSNFSRSSNVAPMVALMANRQLINWRATFTSMIFDRPIIEEHRGDHNRLGFAVQLCTARFLGTFLENLSDTPNGVVAFIEQQLGIRNLSAFEDYCQSVTRKAHPVEIRRRYGFRDFSDIFARFRLNRWLYAPGLIARECFLIVLLPG